MWPGEIGADLGEHSLLRTGQGERQGLAQALGQLRLFQHGRGVRLLGDALAAQAQVVCQQFLQRQPPLRRMTSRQQRGDIGILRRAMHGEQRLAQRRQPEAVAQFARQQFQRLFVRQAIQCESDQAPQRCGADALDGRIDRVQALTQRRVRLIVEHAITGMHDLQAMLARSRRAVAAHAYTRPELRDLRGAEVEKAQHQRAMRIVGDGHAQHRAVTEAALDRLDAPVHLRGHAGLQPSDRRDRGAVLVLPGQLQPQVLQGQQATCGQLLGHARAHPRQGGDRQRLEVDGGPVLARRHRYSMPGTATKKKPRRVPRRGRESVSLPSERACTSRMRSNPHAARQATRIRTAR